MTDADKEVLRRVYQDELRDLKPDLEIAHANLARAAETLGDASRQYQEAARTLGAIDDRVRALRELAARDGITLD